MKLVITARDFSVHDKTALHLLENANLEIVDYGDRELGIGTDEALLYELVKNADFIIAGLEPYRQSLLQRSPNLKMISRRGIGYDSIDIETCKKLGITVARTLGAVEGAVAEHVMAYILYFARRLDIQNASMQQNEWKRIMMPGAKGKTLGLIGFGGIGQEIAKRAVPFDINVTYYCRHPKPEWEEQFCVTYKPLDELLSESDIVSLNIPLTKETKGWFDEACFAKMKKGSIFINIARSPIVDENALIGALDRGLLAGAAIDVFPYEPCTDSPLVGYPNVILTPHTAPYTVENFVEMDIMAAKNIIRFINHELDDKYLVKS